MTRVSVLLLSFALFISSCSGSFSVSEGSSRKLSDDLKNFEFLSMVRLSEDASAFLKFHTDDRNGGYEVVLHNGGLDGTVKTGSLYAVRNLYRSMAQDGEWFPLQISVRGNNVEVLVNGVRVVCYSEPENPYRTEENRSMILGKGPIKIAVEEGRVDFRDVKITALADDANNPYAVLPPVDERNDAIIRLQQQCFPVIDYHVHLKGDLTAEMAEQMSMNYGINYGIAPNAGEGGVGLMLSTDEEVLDYFNGIKDLPFLRGVQGEGRRWTKAISTEALGVYDYLFTDAMTIVDHKGRLARLYHPEEVFYDDISVEGYVDHIVDQTVLILSNEPADIYANPTFLPDYIQFAYDTYWTDSRVDRILDVLEKNGIALEINARYRVPSFDIIRKAKARGIKFTFGTNNMNSDFGRLEYCCEAVKECGLTPEDIWFPSMSTRRDRPTVIYNNFD